MITTDVGPWETPRWSHGSSPLFVCIWSYFGIPVSLDDEEALPIVFLYDLLDVFIEDLNMFIIAVA